MSKTKNISMVRNVLKDMGYTIIRPSICYRQEDVEGICTDERMLFTAYKNEDGSCYRFYVNFTSQYASKSYMYNMDLGLKNRDNDISHWFFEKEANA